MEYKNSAFKEDRKVFIFDNGKDITDMFNRLERRRKEWYEPYEDVFVVNEKYWDYFLEGDSNKTLEIKSKDEFLIKSGKYKYSYIPTQPGYFVLYESPSWLEQDTEEEPSLLKEDIEKHIQIDHTDFMQIFSGIMLIVISAAVLFSAYFKFVLWI